MARVSIEDAGNSTAREARASKGGKASGGARKQTAMIAVGAIAFLVAGVLIYMNLAEAPRPGDQIVSYETTADPAAPSAPAAARTSPSVSASSPGPQTPIVTSPVAGTETKAGPTSRTVGGQP